VYQYPVTTMNTGTLAVNGATTFNDNVTLGSASNDTITVNGTTSGISHDDLELLKKSLPDMSERDRQKSLTLLKQYQKELTQKKGKSKFLDFIKHVYPDYKVGAHHAKLAKLFEEIAQGHRK